MTTTGILTLVGAIVLYLAALGQATTVQAQVRQATNKTKTGLDW